MSDIVNIERLDSNRSDMLRKMYDPMIVFYNSQEKEVENLCSKVLNKDNVQACYKKRQELKSMRLDFSKKIKKESDNINLIIKAFKSASDNVNFLSGPLEEKLISVETDFKNKKELEKKEIHEKRSKQLVNIGLKNIPDNLDKLSFKEFNILFETSILEVKKNEEIERIKREESKKREYEANRIRAAQEQENKKLQEENKKLKDLEEKRNKELEKERAENRAIKEKLESIERANRDKIEAEKEERRKKIEEEKKKRLVPDKNKLLNHIDSMSYSNIHLKSNESILVQDQVKALFDDFIGMSRALINNSL